MTTREQYAVACYGGITLGVQVGDAQPATPELVLGALHVLAAHRRADEDDVAGYVERYVRMLWPGRAYWIEVGDDESWVQVVEYGAFAGKVHKVGGA